MLFKVKEFCNNHFDFKIYWVTAIAFTIAVLIAPMIMFIDPQSKIGYENGLLENIQMAILLFGCWLGISSKTDKKFFYFVSLVLGILIIREVNCGRTLFFPIPGAENAFYSWKDIKYGYLAHPIFGIYIAWVVIYFLKNKLFLNLWNYLCKTALPFWNMILGILGVSLALYAEKATENFVFEEITELLMYVAVVGIIWLYTKHEKFKINAE